jgi:hypothetical protein
MCVQLLSHDATAIAVTVLAAAGTTSYHGLIEGRGKTTCMKRIAAGIVNINRGLLGYSGCVTL